MGQSHTTIQERHDIERRFHDQKATAEHNREDRDFYAAGGLDQMWHDYLSAIGDLRGKKVLDFGCGEGWSTLEYARRGATVYSFDISPESVHNLIREATTAGLAKQIHPAVMAAECLGFPSNSFDLVLGVAILHHTDLRYVGPEVARVLRPGGRALFIEPLAHNWFVQAFRWLTPGRRTPTEQPMTVQQIDQFGRCFRRSTYHGYYLFSVFPQGLFWATGNRWLFRESLRLTETADRVFLKAFPFLQRYCWSAIVEAQR